MQTPKPEGTPHWEEALQAVVAAGMLQRAEAMRLRTLHRTARRPVQLGAALLIRDYKLLSEAMYARGLPFFALENVRVLGTLRSWWMNRLMSTLASTRAFPTREAMLGATYGRLTFLRELGFPRDWQEDPPGRDPLGFLTRWGRLATKVGPVRRGALARRGARRGEAPRHQGSPRRRGVARLT